MGFRSSAFPPAPATTSRSTLALTAHDLIGSLDAFTDGVERRIDMAEVNGRVFLNNVSLGLYGDAVRQPTYRDARARTLLETAAHVLGPSAAAVDLQLVDDRGRAHRNPPPSCSCRTTPTRSSRHVPPGAPVRHSTPVELGILVLHAPGAGRPPG